MKLKNIIITALASLAIVSCDNIAEDDRVLPVEINATDRVVLLTEFTGMGCVNCPEAASIASDLLDKFPDNFIVVAMHPLGHGFVWDNDKVSPRLGRQEAMDYLQAYGGGVTSTLPSGVVNFTNYGEGYLLGSSVWAANVVREIQVEADCNLQLSKTALTDSTFEVKATVQPKASLTAPVSIIYWLVESGMVGEQMTSDKHLTDYVHNHALRECLNGMWGEDLARLTADKEHSINITIPAAKGYVADNCSVVAVIVDTDTHQVLQAAEIALGSGTGH